MCSAQEYPLLVNSFSEWSKIAKTTGIFKGEVMNKTYDTVGEKSYATNYTKDMPNRPLSGSYDRNIEYCFNKLLASKTGSVIKAIVYTKNAVLAGGIFSYFAANHTDVPLTTKSDLDFYILANNASEFNTKLLRIYSIIVDEFEGRHVTIKLRRNAIDFSVGDDFPTFQVITSYYSEITQLLNDFDINVSQICFDGENILYTTNAYIGITTKALKIVNRHPATDLRIRKYMERGFYWREPMPKLDYKSTTTVNVTNLSREIDGETFRKTLKNGGALSFIASGDNFVIYVVVDVNFNFGHIKVPAHHTCDANSLDVFTD